MHYAILLCGPPGAGKSTWYSQNQGNLENFNYASIDEWINVYAARLGKSYGEAFYDVFPEAEKSYMHVLQTSQGQDLNFVVDKTHVNEKSRKKTLKLINPKYKKIAVYFPAMTVESLSKRIEGRVVNGGHNVPSDVVQRFHSDYKVPSYAEGFDLIISVSELDRLFKVMKFQ